MSLTDADAQKAFLKGLAKLAKQTGFRIGGCGCCGSPWATRDERGSVVGTYSIDNDGDLSFKESSDDES